MSLLENDMLRVWVIYRMKPNLFLDLFRRPIFKRKLLSVGYLYVKCGHLIRFHKNLHATCVGITIELTLGTEINAFSHLSYYLEDLYFKACDINKIHMSEK